MIYRINLYGGDDELISTELCEARKVQDANEVARCAVRNGRAVRAEVHHLSGGLAFRAGPRRSRDS